jgi:hypothetical protein
MKQFILLFILLLLLNQSSFSALKNAPKYEDNDVMLRLVYRSTESISAFYQGRGLSHEAINEILKTCFVTVIIINKSKHTLWLVLDQWVFSQPGKIIPRIKRDYWLSSWEKVKLKQAHRSTFGWTLMPETRDLQFDESVGGNVVIPITPHSFSLTARFYTGQDKQGTIKRIHLKDLQCLP